MAGAKEHWRAAVPPKVKFFFWLALHGRLWTRERRKRHGLQLDAACALCNQLDETTIEPPSLLLGVHSRDLLGSLSLHPSRSPRPGRVVAADLGLVPTPPSTPMCFWFRGVRGRRGTAAPSTVRHSVANIWIGAGFGRLALLTALATY